MSKKLFSSFALVAVLLCLTTLAFSQATSESSVKGNLSGLVSDPSGAVVPGAKVTLSGPYGENRMETDSGGRFLFQVLIPGLYSVKISKEGFKTAEIKSVEVGTGRTSSVSVAMELGTGSTVVEVTAGAITVDTTATSVSSNLTDNFYESIPMGRGVTGLFYAAPGVASGGGTGTANPSISGGTGLENNYVADGISITDGGFGGIGVYSRLYGSLGTGINLSFVKEVQVKTGGFEAQYGKSTGGVVQIVTKSGSNSFHGALGGFFAPQQFEATRLQTDDYQLGSQNQRFNLQGKLLHQSNYDAEAELGGYVPGFKDHLFFFGSFNPQWNTDHVQYAQFLNPADLLGGSPSQPNLGKLDMTNRVYSYDGKLTYRLNDKHQVEATIFGDPTYGDFNPNGPTLNTASKTVNDKLQFGTRNFAARYNGTWTPTWLFNASFSWGHNNLDDTPFAPDVYQIADLTQRSTCGAPQYYAICTSPSNVIRGQFTRQGLGYYENTTGDNYGLSFDTQKVFNALGGHTFSIGYRYDQNHYDGTKARTGPTIPITAADAASLTGDPTLQAALVQNGTNAGFQLRAGQTGHTCGKSELNIPGISDCPDGGTGVYLYQTRGEFGSKNFKTRSGYHTIFAQDAWTPSKYVTINAGLRWEEQSVKGVNTHYTFVDNWSPRLGITVDPWGNRKSKAFVNFGRYTEALPLDVAIRSLSNELDFPPEYYTAPYDPNNPGHVQENPDGTFDFSNFSFANNSFAQLSGISASSQESIAHGTKAQYLDEFVVGFEHEFGNSGVIFSTRYTDRRIKRIIEDNAPLSPEAALAGLTQFYLISNVSKNQDLFVNVPQIDYVLGGSIPAGCNAKNPGSVLNGQATDSNGNIVTLANGNNAFCVPNAYAVNPDGSLGAQLVGIPGADGIPDGFVDPSRIYKAIEFEVNKSMSKGWQMRANYRIAKLTGNYEGAFRNDNGQSDPNISSLFDFTRGDFNLLGQQFTPGVLNTDVRHLANGFVSYTLNGNHARGLTLGSSVHFQTGVPINNLFAHPVYNNSGEIPFCADNTTNCPSARGALGREKDYGSVDFHMDYPIRITERAKLRLAADLFNVANTKTLLRVDQNAQRSAGVPNADFLKPTGIGPSSTSGNTNPGYLRPFYARVGVKFEF